MEINRIIKKYSNRRLYDTQTSQYTTLGEIKDLILKHIKVKVIDASTEEDVTNYILMQIINESEAGHTPIFTTEVLQNIIRFYGNPLQKNMSDFLENSFSAFTDKKIDLDQYFQEMIGKNNPFTKLTDIAKQNLAMWEAMQNKTNEAKKTNKKNTSRKKKSDPL
ncbi:MAG: polyhydroxyalkanoate synthesis repressor PhaR [Gammaproteobacteria bacterium]|nr:polyhydroxyalkanoate synthesis repressor PhaR [Gammaproteobacteria bacterium]